MPARTRAQRLGRILRGSLAIVLIVSAALGLGPREAWATGPTDALKGSIDRALMVLTDKALQADEKRIERRRKLEQIVSHRFSYEELTKRVLGGRWHKLSEGERKEVVELFRDLLIKTYADRVEAYSGEPVQYLSERVEKVREVEYAEVRTKAKVGNADVPIDYRLIKLSNGWQVYDVVIDEISLVSNYRSQFKKILATGSYQDLVDQLRKKSDRLSASASPQ